MKCPFPECQKDIEITDEELDHLMYCPHCSKRLVRHYDFFEFLDKNINLFTIFGIFVAIAVVLPSFSQYSINTLNESSNTSQSFYYAPPVSVQIQTLSVLTSLFILGCGIMILLLGCLILMQLFGEKR